MRQDVNRRTLAVAWLVPLALLFGSPALAQTDLSGEWSARYHEDQEHRIPGPELGDYTGLPINDAGRLKADSWDASILTLREHQAKPHPSTYSLRGPANIRISKIFDPVTRDLVAYELFGTFGQATRTMWLDGRPHPPDHAAHTWAGFSTGQWDGDVLTVFSTHFKVGWIQRNGVALSDQATMTEHFIRHGDYLTVVSIVTDPIYLEEPFIRSGDWVLSLTQNVVRTQFDVVDEIAGRAKGYVPHDLPGSDAATRKSAEFASKYGMSVGAAQGGAETTYPEYLSTIQQSRKAPSIRTTPTVAALGSVQREQNRSRPAPRVDTGDIQILPVQGKVYMLVGAGANITVQVGDEGVLLVDTGAAQMSEKVLAAVRQLSDKPIRFVINSQVGADHVGGNESVARVGQPLSGNAPGNFGIAQQGAQVIAHEKVLTRMSAPTGRQAAMPFGAWPTETFFGADKDLFFNNEAIQLVHQPAAHTDGDVLIFFRRSDVVSTGDLFSTTGYPVIDAERGGTIQGIIDGLNRIIDVTIPKDKEEGGTYVIPGHGRLCDEADVVEYRDMVTIIRDRIRDLIRRRMSLPQVKAARPTRDYNGRYGTESGPWTTDMFIEAIYNDLNRK